MRTQDQLLTGPFTYLQARAAGLTRTDVRRLVQTGTVRRLLRDVYVPAELSDSLQTRVSAARLVVPTHAVFCDRTAAWLHGVDTLDLHELALPPRLDLVMLPDFTRRRRGELTPRVRDLAPHDLMHIGGLRVTTPLRTAMDLGCQLHRRSALAALDGFSRVHHVTPSDVELELPRFRGRRGVVQLRSLALLMDGRAESPPESWLRLAVIDAGLTPPQPQVWVARNGIPVYRLDLGYPELLVGLEYDGEEPHAPLEQQRYDEERRAWLRAQGWIIIVVTRDDWDQRSVARWMSDLRRAVAMRRAPRHVRRFAKLTAPSR